MGSLPRNRFVGRVARLLFSVDPTPKNCNMDRFLQPIHWTATTR